MKKLRKFLYCLFLLGMASCSQDVITEPDSPDILPDNGYADTPAYELLKNYYNDGRAGSRVDKPFEILEVTSKTYRIENDCPVETEITDTQAVIQHTGEETFDVSLAILQFADTRGYACFSASENVQRVFFFTENGLPSDTAFIPPLKELLDGAPYIAMETLQSKDSIQARKRSYGENRYYKDDICPFYWGQHGPYNWYASVDSGTGIQNPIGCVTTAVAQAIATMGYFPGTFYGNKNLDFSKLRPTYYPLHTVGLGITLEEKWEIAQYFHEIALGCQIKFGAEGSGTTLKAAYNYLVDLGFDCQYSERFDEYRIMEGLRYGRPLLIRGVRSSGGHAWLITGAREQPYGIDYWCNWGWNGSSDGWSANNPYTPTNNPNTPPDLWQDPFPKNNKYIYLNAKLK